MDTLKGIAISMVLINHYFNFNFSGDSIGFAYTWVSIFFFLSGYGLFFSFNRQLASNPNYLNSRNLFLFYYHRFIRIFPLLWAAWLIELLVRGGNLSFWIPFGIHGTGHYWFIPALLQCYLLSPLIYWGINNKPIIFIILLMVGIIIINFLFFSNFNLIIIKKLASFTNSQYIGIYFLHVLVFALGFLVSSFIHAKSLRKFNRSTLHSIVFWLFTFSIVISMIILKYYVHHNLIIKVAFHCAPLLPIALLSIYSLVFSIENKIFSFLGSISYSIYLFHMSFYLLFNKVGGFPKNSTKGLIWFLLIFPGFIFACYHLEQFGNYINRKLKVLSSFTKSRKSASPDAN